MISHPEIKLNVRDRQGMTPFACAMTYKNNKAAEAILKREPGAAEQVSWKDLKHASLLAAAQVCTTSKFCFIVFVTLYVAVFPGSQFSMAGSVRKL
mgnify:CR=1 FL=1